MSQLPIDSTPSALLSPSPTTLSLRQELEQKLSLLDTEAQPTSSTSPLTRADLFEPIERINTVFRPRGIEFAISEQSARVVTKVIDRETGDVIRQIPAEEVLLVAERLEEIQGRLISLEA